MELKPTKLLLEIPEKDRTEWAEWLETTTMVQNYGSMSNGVNTACCLHVFECGKQNDGKWFNANDCEYPVDLKNPSKLSGRLPENLIIAESRNKGYYPSSLNDVLKLSFYEIAQILRGNTLELKDDE